MTDRARLIDAITATWPPAAVTQSGPFAIGHGEGGGNRVSAARLIDAASDGAHVSKADIAAAAETQREIGQPAIFMVFEWQTGLDRALAQDGYTTRDATDLLLATSAELAEPPPPVTCFDVWPPLAAQDEIWAAAGIGPARLAIMDRAAGPKTAIFGRTKDRPAGTGFVALHGDVAMLHALEVLPAARRNGLGRIMVRAAADWARHAGARDFTVLVTQANAAAQALYASLGLTRVSQYHYRVASQA